MRFLLLALAIILAGCAHKKIQSQERLVCVAVDSKDLMVDRPIEQITQGDLGNRVQRYTERYLLDRDVKTKAGECQPELYKLVIGLLTLEEVTETGHLLGKAKSKTYYKIKYDAILTKNGEKIWIDSQTKQDEKIDEILEIIAKEISEKTDSNLN
jgi:hypothetical protein